MNREDFENEIELEEANIFTVENVEQFYKFYPLTDIATTQLFYDLYCERFCYVPELKEWRAYTSIKWVVDNDGIRVKNAIEEFSLGIYEAFSKAQKEADAQREAIAKETGTVDVLTAEGKGKNPLDDIPDYKSQISYYRNLQSSKRRNALFNDCGRKFAKGLLNFDTDNNLLNFQNGTLDLRTFEFKGHKAEDYITKALNARYDESACFPRFDEFIDQVMESDAERISYLQKALGYSISGNPVEECLFIPYGKTSRNGKSTFFNAVADAVGDYAVKIDFATFSKNKAVNDGAKPKANLLSLKDRRFIQTDEPPISGSFDEQILKQLTGNDFVSARPLYSNTYIQFRLEGVIFVISNHLPSITDKTMFISQRVKLLNFPHHFGPTQQDKTLKEQFSSDKAKDYIIQWILQGYKRYREEGLQDTAEMKRLLFDYVKDNDIMSKFIEECLVKTETIKTPLTVIRKWYHEWCKDNGIVPYQLRRFQKEFLESCHFDISYGQHRVYVKACRKAADEIIKIESKEATSSPKTPYEEQLELSSE